ncbi:MAG TPA: TetR/AcrR family transcriptional regulator [Solirubrobacteraceae bacterium]|jgi:AcrR family transcriptional regulator|nr:TetR/AcrR family transcriptional regulator [Solirubrobacteraceae bacterium]
MSPRSHRTAAINSKVQRRPKSSQRERLIEGMIAVGNRDGYAGASVSTVIAEAGVSKPTFYDYFDDKDECFLAALVEVHASLMEEFVQELERAEAGRAAQSAVKALVGFASANPSRARFLMGEAMAGRRALDARDRGISQLAAAIDEVSASANNEETISDIPSEVLVGAIYRLLSSRLRRGEPAISELLEPALEWLEGYSVPRWESRWRSPDPPMRMARVSPAPRLWAPAALGRGRPRLSSEDVAQAQRLRIMFAAAALAAEKGYAATTVADITELARVDRRAFYSLFADKRDAFMAVHEFGLQEVMAVTAGAFFTGSSWPERMWAAGQALTQFLEANPTIAHLGFVEAYSVGPSAAQRVEDSQAAFTIFLQEGNAYRPNAAPPSRVVLEAIIKSIFEIVYARARTSARPSLSDAVPGMTFLSLAPFIGAREANAFVDEKAKSRPAKPVPSDRASGRSD